MNTTEFKAALQNPYAWPGGYPTFFIMEDGAALCHKCAQNEVETIVESIESQAHDGWCVIAHDVNWKDTELYCAHCNQRIESTYGDNE